jgi:hypothetical protein
MACVSDIVTTKDIAFNSQGWQVNTANVRLELTIEGTFGRFKREFIEVRIGLHSYAHADGESAHTPTPAAETSSPRGLGGNSETESSYSKNGTFGNVSPSGLDIDRFSASDDELDSTMVCEGDNMHHPSNIESAQQRCAESPDRQRHGLRAQVITDKPTRVAEEILSQSSYRNFADADDLARLLRPHLLKMQKAGRGVEDILKDPAALTELLTAVASARTPLSTTNSPITTSTCMDISTESLSPHVPSGDEALKIHPQFGLYIKSPNSGVPREALLHKFKTDEVNPLDQDKPLPREFMTTQDSVKAIAVGHAKEDVKHKMGGEDMNSETLNNPDAPVASATPVTHEQVAMKDHPEYAKYFKLLKFGMDPAGIKLKMKAEGLDPDMLDQDPNAPAPTAANEASAKVALKDHPGYAKYFKMMKVGLGKETVKHKLRQEASHLDAEKLECDPDTLVDVEPAEEKVALENHPVYEKYFRMLKMGLPRGAALNKMIQDGVEPSILDLDPSTLVPLKNNGSVTETKVTAAQPKKANVRRKKLHWQAIPPDRLKRGGNIWADLNENAEEVKIDMDEFEELFVARGSPNKDKAKAKSSAPKKQRVTLVDGKRAQNCAIALARIKMTYAEVRTRVLEMQDSEFSSDQLVSLQEFLPTPEEVTAVKGYVDGGGVKELLGEAEKFMAEFLDVKDAKDILTSMLYMKQFQGRLAETLKQADIIDSACNDVLRSTKLRKILSVVLTVGNHMNQDSAAGAMTGFTLDSLLKLRNTKGFDGKTSALHYVVKLVQKNDETALDFKADMRHVPAASRVQLDTIECELGALRQGFEHLRKTAEAALKISVHLPGDVPSHSAQAAGKSETAEEQAQTAELKLEKKVSKESVLQLRRRTSHTRTTKASSSYSVVHYDRAVDVCELPLKIETCDKQRKSKGTFGSVATAFSLSVQTVQPGAAPPPHAARTSTHRMVLRSDSAASDTSSVSDSDNGPNAPEHNVLQFLHSASTQLEERSSMVKRVSQGYQGVLEYFSEDPKMASTDFFNTLNAFVMASAIYT